MAKQHQTRSYLTWMRRLTTAIALLLLTGCLLISGETTMIDLQDGSGNLLTTFVGAEGQQERILDVGLPATELQVIVIVGVESGDLALSLLQPEGSVVFTVAARPDLQVTRSGSVRTNERGQLRYTVNAAAARNGSYQIFVQP
ncbi:hypothetical protein [Candidatus Chloroploca asiatica]|uniref:Uncharacterized protein n=1 Tax=Candidatus Chloroploca asiatica TaxID=1506545 RepID=A0A2H3L7R8_9CHLR|nr:hypothetical protein [Candidatus Chloroploca asiatica]PDW01258.1 hypothetical protein A9Q02_07430 [Candidatus Chloroploca asiatica]